MNPVAVQILEQYGIVTLPGPHLVDDGCTKFVQKISKRICTSHEKKGTPSPASLYFGNSLFCGEENHMKTSNDYLVIKPSLLKSHDKTIFSPRFCIAIIRLKLKEMLNLPVVTARRSASSNRRRTNAVEMIENFLLDSFDAPAFLSLFLLSFSSCSSSFCHDRLCFVSK